MQNRNTILLAILVLAVLIGLLVWGLGLLSSNNQMSSSDQVDASIETVTEPTNTPDRMPTPTTENGATATSATSPLDVRSLAANSPLPTPAPNNPPTALQVYTYEVVNSYPHDPDAFTQGLIWLDNVFYEGTGLRGRSSLRKVNLTDGAVLQQVDLPDEYFGEGITVWGGQILQLTWQSRVGFVYDLESFEQINSFTYPTEGWGITHDGTELIMSDGTPKLYFMAPESLTQSRSIDVTLEGEPLQRLNELEYINGMVYANIWQTNLIAIINPSSGVVVGMINLDGLLDVPPDPNHRPDVLNGIAYDATADRLFVTGKLWPRLYEIKLLPVVR